MAGRAEDVAERGFIELASPDKQMQSLEADKSESFSTCLMDDDDEGEAFCAERSCALGTCPSSTFENWRSAPLRGLSLVLSSVSITLFVLSLLPLVFPGIPNRQCNSPTFEIFSSDYIWSSDWLAHVEEQADEELPGAYDEGMRATWIIQRLQHNITHHIDQGRSRDRKSQEIWVAFRDASRQSNLTQLQTALSSLDRLVTDMAADSHYFALHVNVAITENENILRDAQSRYDEAFEEERRMRTQKINDDLEFKRVNGIAKDWFTVEKYVRVLDSKLKRAEATIQSRYGMEKKVREDLRRCHGDVERLKTDQDTVHWDKVHLCVLESIRPLTVAGGFGRSNQASWKAAMSRAKGDRHENPWDLIACLEA